MTNAQWMLENRMDFKHISIKSDPNCFPLENFGRTKCYRYAAITWKGIVLTTFKAEAEKFAMLRAGIAALVDWLDKEHKEILADDENLS